MLWGSAVITLSQWVLRTNAHTTLWVCGSSCIFWEVAWRFLHWHKVHHLQLEIGVFVKLKLKFRTCDSSHGSLLNIKNSLILILWTGQCNNAKNTNKHLSHCFNFRSQGKQQTAYICVLSTRLPTIPVKFSHVPFTMGASHTHWGVRGSVFNISDSTAAQLVAVISCVLFPC